MKRKTFTELICYCCGAELGKVFALVSAARKPERVFTMRLECLPRADNPGGTTVKVLRR